MKIGVVLIAILAFLTVTVSAQELRVIETGSFHGDEVDAKDGEFWLGLYKQGDAYMLMPSVLAVESVYDAIIDAAGESSGKSISVPGMGKPLLLLQGKGFEQARPVTAINLTTNDMALGFDEPFEFKGQGYRLRVESDKQGSGDFISSAAKLVFSNGKMRQVVYEVEECSFCRWRVDWAGDLDSDGKPDFYLFLTNHYNVSNQKLFLSSKAGSGKLLKEVAEFTTTGC